jgi:hypothetical protein
MRARLEAGMAAHGAATRGVPDSRPVKDVEIDGLILGVPGADWRTLDDREAAYDRVMTVEVVRALDWRPEVSIYTIPDGRHGAPDRTHPVLLSYVDVVVQGYLREFGEEGVARFF